MATAHRKQLKERKICCPDLLFALDDGQSLSHQLLVDAAEVGYFFLAFMMDVHATLCTENTAVCLVNYICTASFVYREHGIKYTQIGSTRKMYRFPTLKPCTHDCSRALARVVIGLISHGNMAPSSCRDSCSVFLHLLDGKCSNICCYASCWKYRVVNY